MMNAFTEFTSASFMGFLSPSLIEVFSVWIHFVSFSFLSLFTIMNPLGATAFFLSHPDISQSKDYRGKVAKRAAIACFIALTAFAVFGQLLFTLMGITITSFQIAGGIFIFLVAIDMLRGANVRAKTLPEERENALEKDDISIIPLAIPLLAGPGAITVIILTMTKAQGILQTLSVFGLIMVVCYITYWILVRSGYLIRLLGESGIRVMNRLMGLLIGAIAVEMFLSGIRSAFAGF